MKRKSLKLVYVREDLKKNKISGQIASPAPEKDFIYIINKLKQIFVAVEHNQASNYIGIHLKQNDDFSITINQIDYIKSINEIKVNGTLKRNKNDKLTEKETTSLAGALGKSTG